MAFSQRPRSPPLPHLRNTRLVLRPFPPLVKLATLSWRCSVRATARILSILGNDAVFVQRRPAILTAAPMRHRPSIDGDREMTSEVTPNEASPRETSDSQAALAPCLVPGQVAELDRGHTCAPKFPGAPRRDFTTNRVKRPKFFRRYAPEPCKSCEKAQIFPALRARRPTARFPHTY